MSSDIFWNAFWGALPVILGMAGATWFSKVIARANQQKATEVAATSPICTIEVTSKLDINSSKAAIEKELMNQNFSLVEKNKDFFIFEDKKLDWFSGGSPKLVYKTSYIEKSGQTLINISMFYRDLGSMTSVAGRNFKIFCDFITKSISAPSISKEEISKLKIPYFRLKYLIWMAVAMVLLYLVIFVISLYY